MLQIPDEIKELLHRDSCQKNIRIHFPNGERSDICNNLIVKDSVSFTESLCSQNTLKFGLSEASVFECEVVGVGNIKGATIEVNCEIYCDASVTGAIWQNDLMAYVYQIPYGVFVVTDAKRQADMNHRKIVAYSDITANGVFLDESHAICDEYNYKVKASNPEIGKNYVLSSSNTVYSYDLMRRLSARVNVPLSNDYEYNLESGDIHTGYITAFPIPGYSMSLAIGTDWSYLNSINESQYGELYYADVNQATMTRNEILDGVRTMLLNNSISGAAAIKATLKYVEDFLDYPYERPSSSYSQYSGLSIPYIAFSSNGSYLPNNEKVICGFTESSIYVYPFKHSATPSVNCQIWIPCAFGLETSGGTNVDSFRYREGIYNNYSFRLYKVTSSIFNKFIYTQKRVKTNMYVYPSGVKTNNTGYILDDTITSDFYKKMLPAAYEIQGLFGKVSRINIVDLIDLKQQFALLPSNTLYPGNNLYPEGVTGGKLLPNDYQSCWYEDDYTKSFGMIRCQYKDTNNEDALLFYYLSGYSEESNVDEYQIYDLSNNVIISSGSWSQSDIEYICGMVANHIIGVTYMPVEFVGRGLPYVEAGDTFEILTASNDSITTIVLNRTVSGEQVLTDSYKSVS